LPSELISNIITYSMAELAEEEALCPRFRLEDLLDEEDE
jgi:hypothetical protein